MRLSPINAFLTRAVFRFGLLKRAYTREAVESLVARSRFGTCRIEPDGIGFELQLSRPDPARTTTSRAHSAA